MGIVMRYGRPPRLGPVIVKPTRERMQLLGAAAVRVAGETVAHGERDATGDDVICGCPRHYR